MKLLAIPNFGDRVSPRLDYAESLQLITIDGKEVIKKETVKIIVHSNLERINLIIGLKPNVVICDGISDLTLNKLTEIGVEVLPWIHGQIDEVAQKFIDGKLKIKTVKT